MRDKLKTLFSTGFFHVFGGNVLNKILVFLSSVILVRILTKQEYGIFTYSWNIYNIVILLSGMGIASGLLQICSEKGGEPAFCNHVLHYSVKQGILFNGLLGVVLLLLAFFAPLKEGADILLFMLCFLPLIQILYDLSTSYLRSQKRNQEYVRLTVINTALVLVVSACCAFYFKQKGLIMGYYAAYLVTVLYAVIVIKIPIFNRKTTSALNNQTKRTLFKISFISMCNNGLSQLLYLLDVLVIGIIVADESVLASYKVGTMIPSALAFIPLSLMTYVYPYFAEKRLDKKWCWKRYKQIVIGFGLFNLFICLCLFILAPWIVHTFFGAQYDDSVAVFRILSINYFFSGTFRVVSGNLLITQRKLKFNLLVACVSGVVNVIADIVLIYFYGSIGAAIATVLVTLVSGILSTVYLIYTLKKDNL